MFRGTDFPTVHGVASEIGVLSSIPSYTEIYVLTIRLFLLRTGPRYRGNLRVEGVGGGGRGVEDDGRHPVG